MFDKGKNIGKLVQAQNRIKKQMEQIFVSEEKKEYKIVMRGDKRVEKIEINGEEDKDLRNLINHTMKQVDKKELKWNLDGLKDRRWFL